MVEEAKLEYKIVEKPPPAKIEVAEIKRPAIVAKKIVSPIKKSQVVKNTAKKTFSQELIQEI